MKLYPNCSEVVWRLKYYPKNKKEKLMLGIADAKLNEEFETDTSTYPNSCVANMFYTLREIEELDMVDLDFVDNKGGGGNADYVEAVFNLVIDYIKNKKGKITEKDLEKLEELEKQKWNY